MEAFAPLVTIRQTDFQFKIVGAAVVRAGAIKRDKRRHLDRQTLFDVGRVPRLTLTLSCAGGVASLIAGSGPDVQSGRMSVKTPTRASRPGAALS
jgi:hypothetical protein